MMKIGDKFVQDAFGKKYEYEVDGYDGSGRPTAHFVKVVTEDIITEEKIEKAKEVVAEKEKKATPKKPVAKKK